MMRLITRYLGETDGQHAVAWRVGTARSGIVCVTDISGEDSGPQAEMAAMKHLLFVKEIFNRKLLSGKGVALSFSCPVIRKAAKKKTSKTHLIPLAHFIGATLSEAELENTEKDCLLPTLEALEDEETPVETISALASPAYDVIETPAIGLVRLKQHAIDQFKERNHSGELTSPKLSLITRLQNPNIQRQSLSDKVMKHKMKKYGDISCLEVWGHDSSQLHYLILRDPKTGIGTLVTVYHRHPEYAHI